MATQTERTPRPLEGDAALIRAVGSFAVAAAVMKLIVGGGFFRMPSALSARVGFAAPLALVAGTMAISPVALVICRHWQSRDRYRWTLQLHARHLRQLRRLRGRGADVDQ